MIVRQATPKDIPYILALYKKGLDEIGLTDWKESLLLNKIVNSFHLAPCFLLVNDGTISGMAGFTTVTSSHNGVASLADYMFYIDPDVRNHETLSQLVQEAKDFAKQHAMPLKIEFISRNDLQLRERVMRRHGFEDFSVTGVYNGQ